MNFSFAYRKSSQPPANPGPETAARKWRGGGVKPHGAFNKIRTIANPLVTANLKLGYWWVGGRGIVFKPHVSIARDVWAPSREHIQREFSAFGAAVPRDSVRPDRSWAQTCLITGVLQEYVRGDYQDTTRTQAEYGQKTSSILSEYSQKIIRMRMGNLHSNCKNTTRMLPEYCRGTTRRLQ